MQPERYPCFDLAISAGRAGGTAPAALSAADEVAVQSFLDGAIRFTDIYRVVAQTLDEHQNQPHPALDDILDADRRASARAGAIAAAIAASR